MLVFVFLSLTSVVAIWRDVSNGQLTLATAWNITNSLIFGAFIITAFREQSANRRAARQERDADTAPVLVLAAAAGLEPAPALRTQVVRPDSLQPARDVITASAASGTPTPRGGRLVTWTNRLRLYGGILVVLVVVAACTLVFNQRQSAVASTSAAITAQEYAVGTDYGGTVTEEYVEEGDTVQEGEKLMQVQSLQLAQDIRKGVVGANTKTSAYEIAPDGLITFKAEVSGTVAKLDVKAGGYVQAGSELGTIHKSQSLFVTSEFLVSPPRLRPDRRRRDRRPAPAERPLARGQGQERQRRHRR
ncbi:hypothetical protein [Curtobacterium sp. MCPF17_052]|uniref:hypothetical protein n=1 Tax=Curtobacterium sp. MCPF17_052 TaxID=2175655 RepID=UPI0024DFFEE3|nr:hypothetical protein [Curtobacterium sp. MCPF17_052]WIB13748.1 hypothetical protein DEJ36_08785 [Curtobacterium sp. MCPF17_052]